MRRSRNHNAILTALYMNAALLLAVVVVLISRDSTPSFLSGAFAQEQQPIAGGGGVFVMPAQFGEKTFGCYLLDIDAQTLCVYQYAGADKTLRLIAARNFRFDRRLGNFNTFPVPKEVEQLVEKERDASRVGEPPNKAAAQ